jgi:hypothetical protein
MILIGGAVLISKRDDIKEGPSVGAPKPAVTPAVTPTVPEPPSEASPTPPLKPDNAVHEKLEVSPSPPPPPSPAPTLKPPTAPDLGRVDGSKPVVPAHKAPQTPRPRSAPSPVTTTVDSGKTSAGRTSAAPGGAAFESQEAPDKVEAGLTKTGEAPVDETKSADAAPAQSRGPTPKQVLVDQLLVQCRSAATRGDCEEAKLLARRIAAQSTAYYKEHVANDTTIQKCITPVQAPNAVSQ